jgi:peptidoglycan glycosyltransferase
VNAPLRKVAIALVALFVLLLVNANVVQVGEAKSLTSNSHNRRVLIDDYRRQRGDIIAGGQAVALSTETNDKLKYLRTYPGGSLFAPLTGYYSLTLGETGIEKSENGVLSGNDSRLSISFDRLSQLLSGRTLRGGNVTLTIDRAAQQIAAKALGNRRGAVVALDPRTGAVLAMVTSPSYDPGLLTGHDSATIGKNYQTLLKAPGNPLLNRATQQSYPPGSTFKVIVTAAALSTGNYTAQTQVPSPDTIVLPGTTKTLSNFAGESCGGPTSTLLHALEISCNTAYAKLGLALGADRLRSMAEAFGFDSTVDDVGVPVAASKFPDSDHINLPQTALSAIGQYDVRATPLQMAMVAAAIGNGGTLMQPYVVAQEQGPDLKVLSKTEPKKLGQPITGTVANELTQMMVGVVDQGTGTAARISGVSVAGKTGTADTGVPGAKPDSWFISFAPAANPTVAIAVLVENGGGEVNTTGGAVAAPIAKQVMEQLLKDAR